MKKLVLALAILISSGAQAASIIEGLSKAELTSTPDVTEVIKFVEVKGSTMILHSGNGGSMKYKCIQLEAKAPYDEIMVCDEDGGAPLVDRYVYKMKAIFGNKVYIDATYIGDFNTGTLDNVKADPSLVESSVPDAEFKFVLQK